MDIFQVILCGNVLRIVALGSLQLMHPRLQIGNGGHAWAQNDSLFSTSRPRIIHGHLPRVFFFFLSQIRFFWRLYLVESFFILRIDFEVYVLNFSFFYVHCANGNKEFAEFPLIRLSNISPVPLHPTIFNCLSLLSICVCVSKWMCAVL